MIHVIRDEAGSEVGAASTVQPQAARVECTKALQAGPEAGQASRRDASSRICISERRQDSSGSWPDQQKRAHTNARLSCQQKRNLEVSACELLQRFSWGPRISEGF